MESKGPFAYITLATDNNYGRGALVLGHSLRLVKTEHRLVILVTSTVTSTIRNKLFQVFDCVKDVSVLDSEDAARLSLMKRPELGVTFTKLHCWKQTEFSKCVFLDADTLVLKNCDELFERNELSAVPDIGWPDCFNSGVFVFKPSLETYKKLLNTASKEGSFDGGDQGLLNEFFSDWATKDISQRLSFIYNMSASSNYSYVPAYKKFGDKVKIVHFLGSSKPWMHKFNRKTGFTDLKESDTHMYEHLLRWWEIYVQHVEPEQEDTESIDKGVQDLSLSATGQEKPMETSQGPSLQRGQPSETERREAWEHGQIDYMGRDSFENILNKLDDVIKNGEKKEET